MLTVIVEYYINKHMKKNLNVFSLICLLFYFSGYSQESEFVKIEGGKLHYKIYGSGQPVLIINGGPGMNSDGFSSLAELLSDDYMAILFDQRGTGQSELQEVDSKTVTMDLMLQDIEALRIHLKIEEWVILGHSFGGFLAQYYAVFHPDRIKGMILSGSGGIDLEIFDYIGGNRNARLSKTEEDSLSYWQNQIKNGDNTYVAKYNKGRFLAPAYLYGRENIPQIAHRLTQGNSKIRNLVISDLRRINYDCKETLKNFEKPVLIIQGRQDIVGDGTAYKAYMVLKNSSLKFLNECGHYGWLDQKEKYIKEVKTFINRESIRG